MMHIEYYRKENGACPFKEFVDALPVSLQVKVMGGVDVLAEGGTSLREPLTKALGDGLFEMRVSLGALSTRSFFFFVSGGKIVITNGFLKKSQKTPKRELRLAKAYRKDWLRRHG